MPTYGISIYLWDSTRLPRSTCVLVKHLDQKLFAYLLVLWFAGTTITQAIHAFLPSIEYYPYTFVLINWVDYFPLEHPS